MNHFTLPGDRRTNADLVFDYLREEIVSLRLLPGTKLSELEIAERFKVSRQPVREAFSRLGNMDLLLIRPQKATEVQLFSSRTIATARFVRAAVEAQVLRECVKIWNGSALGVLQDSLAQQEVALETVDADLFHQLDYEFHKALCAAANCDFVFDTIAENKAQVDRLCVLSLMHKERMQQLFVDHKRIVDLLAARDEEGVVDAAMLHLSRLDGTINEIRRTHSEYFED